jgi:hypothetical protein
MKFFQKVQLTGFLQMKRTVLLPCQETEEMKVEEAGLKLRSGTRS